MPKHVIETVTFKLNEGVERAAFIKAAESTNAYVTDCVGFVSRRLSCTEDGDWVEHIEWSNMDAAKAASAGIADDSRNAEFLVAINGATVKVMHSELEISVN